MGTRRPDKTGDKNKQKAGRKRKKKTAAAANGSATDTRPAILDDTAFMKSIRA